MDETVSTIRHTLVLRRLEPARNVARFYALMIERDLFGHVVLVRHWGRIGGRGRERTDEHVAIQVRFSNHQGESDEHLRDLANQRLIQVLNEIEMALVG